MNEIQSKRERLRCCNELILTIASVGRKFFSNLDDSMYFLPVAVLELDHRGRVYFKDCYIDPPVYTHWKYRRWKRFHHGGTMQDLIARMRDYILHGRQLTIVNPTYPKLFNSDGGDMWGYGPEATEIVNNAALELGIMKAREVQS